MGLWYLCGMDVKDINDRLYEKGVSLKMCDEVCNKWNRVLDEQELINLWYANYDFAVINHYPSNRDIQECFNKKILRQNNVLVDDVWSLLNPKKAMILGQSESNIRFNSFNVGQVWVRDEANVNIIVRDHADVTICAIEHARVNIINYNSTSRVLVIKYSPTAKITTTGTKIRIVENYQYLKNS